MTTSKDTKRRPKGEGSIQQLANGKYKVVLTIGKGAEGKQARRSATCKTQGEALKKLNEFRRERDQGTLVPKQPTTVAEFCEGWLEFKKRRIRASTYRLYESTVNANIVPHIGSLKLQKVTTRDIDGLIDDLMGGDLSRASVSVFRVILHNIFDLALRRELILTNPVIRSGSVKVDKKEMKILSQEEAKRLLEAAKERGKGNVYYVLLLALATGMRRGELLGLTWENVYESSVRVARNLVQVKGGTKVEQPKTASGRRTIAVAKWVLDEVRTLMVDGSKVVFANGGGEPWAPTSLIAEVRRLMGLCGIVGVRFHDLRHTHATQLIAQGLDIKSVSKRLGHENIKTTLDLYAHWLPEKDDVAANVMGEWLR